MLGDTLVRLLLFKSSCYRFIFIKASCHYFKAWIKQRSLIPGHSGWVTCVELTPDCTRLVTGSKDAHIMVWDTETGAVIRRLEQDAEITCLVSYPLLSEGQ